MDINEKDIKSASNNQIDMLNVLLGRRSDILKILGDLLNIVIN